MPARRRLLLLLASLAVLAFAAAPPDAPAVRFVHLTDTHVVDLAGVAPPLAAARRHFAGSARALESFFAAAGKNPPAFYLVTGDLIDAFRFSGDDGRPVYRQVDAFRRVAATSPAPLYLALGNHDIWHYGWNAGKLAADQSVAGEARAAWTAAADCFRQGTYYSFERRAGSTRYLFLVLDNGFTGGEISREQLLWLGRQLQQSGGAAVILAMHIPLGSDAVSLAIRNAAANGAVRLVLAGHRHTNGVEQVALGSHTVTQVRTAAFGYGENNWRSIRLLEDRIEISAPGEAGRIETTVSAGAAAPVR